MCRCKLRGENKQVVCGGYIHSFLLCNKSSPNIVTENKGHLPLSIFVRLMGDSADLGQALWMSAGLSISWDAVSWKVRQWWAGLQ